MNIIVPIKQVPDLAEELEIDSDGTGLDREYMTYVINEFDEQAIEEAVLLKEEHGGTVTVVALDIGEADQVLFTAAAKGATALIKVTGDFEDAPPDSHSYAEILAGVLDGRDYDLVFTGVQAADDLDGQVGPLLGSRLGIPHVSVVASVAKSDLGVRVSQEYGGGVTAQIDVPTPAVIGVQAARQTPRYAPIARVRQMMKEVTIEEVDAPVTTGSGLRIRKMSKPVSSSHAEMITGSTEDVADKVVALLRERGLVKA